jgi:hypothetical protein
MSTAIPRIELTPEQQKEQRVNEIKEKAPQWKESTQELAKKAEQAQVSAETGRQIADLHREVKSANEQLDLLTPRGDALHQDVERIEQQLNSLLVVGAAAESAAVQAGPLGWVDKLIGWVDKWFKPMVDKINKSPTTKNFLLTLAGWLGFRAGLEQYLGTPLAPEWQKDMELITEQLKKNPRLTFKEGDPQAKGEQLKKLHVLYEARAEKDRVLGFKDYIGAAMGSLNSSLTEVTLESLIVTAGTYNDAKRKEATMIAAAPTPTPAAPAAQPTLPPGVANPEKANKPA